MGMRGADERGQASVEFAVVVAAFLSIVVALGAVWHAARDGRLLAIAREASSHNMEGEAYVVQDVTAY